MCGKHLEQSLLLATVMSPRTRTFCFSLWNLICWPMWWGRYTMISRVVRWIWAKLHDIFVKQNRRNLFDTICNSTPLINQHFLNFQVDTSCKLSPFKKRSQWVSKFSTSIQWLFFNTVKTSVIIFRGKIQGRTGEAKWSEVKSQGIPQGISWKNELKGLQAPPSSEA